MRKFFLWIVLIALAAGMLAPALAERPRIILYTAYRQMGWGDAVQIGAVDEKGGLWVSTGYDSELKWPYGWERQLEYLGYPVICIDHLEQIIPAIKTILTWTPGETFPGKGGMKDSRNRRMEEDESSGLYAFSDSEDRERDVLRQAVTQLQRAAYQQLQIQKMEDILIREKRRERERRKDRKPINTDCEFHDWKDNKDVCRIHMDMQFCSRDCAFATTGAGSTAPYGTKYMKGRL